MSMKKQKETCDEENKLQHFTLCQTKKKSAFLKSLNLWHKHTCTAKQVYIFPFEMTKQIIFLYDYTFVN